MSNIHQERMELMCLPVIHCLLMWVGHQTADIVGNMLWQTRTVFTLHILADTGFSF